MKIVLKETLKKKNMSQYRLSEMTGITKASISEICNNKRDAINFSTLDKICDALDCDISDILERDKKV